MGEKERREQEEEEAKCTDRHGYCCDWPHGLRAKAQQVCNCCCRNHTGQHSSAEVSVYAQTALRKAVLTSQHAKQPMEKMGAGNEHLHLFVWDPEGRESRKKLSRVEVKGRLTDNYGRTFEGK